MERYTEKEQKIFDTLVEETIEDLRKSGLDKEEILHIVKEQFGLRYVRKLYEEE